MLIVQSVSEQALLGISLASIVEDDGTLQERVTFFHPRVGTDAIIKRSIEGREHCVSALGNSYL